MLWPEGSLLVPTLLNAPLEPCLRAMIATVELASGADGPTEPTTDAALLVACAVESGVGALDGQRGCRGSGR